MDELVKVLSQIRDWMAAIFLVLIAIEVVLIIAYSGGKSDG